MLNETEIKINQNRIEIRRNIGRSRNAYIGKKGEEIQWISNSSSYSDFRDETKGNNGLSKSGKGYRVWNVSELEDGNYIAGEQSVKAEFTIKDGEITELSFEGKVIYKKEVAVEIIVVKTNTELKSESKTNLETNWSDAKEVIVISNYRFDVVKYHRFGFFGYDQYGNYGFRNWNEFRYVA